MRNIVAVIPARGGSKGIPKKNLIDFCGKPLIAWSILQAQASTAVNSVWVTSDDSEILSVAEMFGAKPILRPPSLSGDKASSESAWLHALNFIESQTNEVDLFVGMQATSPLRHAEDLDNAIISFINKDLDSLLSVTEVEDFFMWKLNKNGKACSLNYDFNTRKPRQQIEKQYLENGSFYIFKPNLLKRTNNRLGGEIGFYVMDKYKMFQIDCYEDIDLCANLMKGYGLVNA